MIVLPCEIDGCEKEIRDLRPLGKKLFSAISSSPSVLRDSIPLATIKNFDRLAGWQVAVTHQSWRKNSLFCRNLEASDL